jgi:hypothetical protein
MTSFQFARSGRRVSIAITRRSGASSSVENQNTGPSLPRKL